MQPRAQIDRVQRIVGGGLVALTIATLWSPTAHAESEALSRARKQYDNLDYVKADRSYHEALSSRGNRPSDLVDIYLHLGVLAASMGRNDEAVGHFQRMLCIDPDAALPQELAPKVMRQIAAAKKTLPTVRPFRLSHTPTSQLPVAGGLDVVADLSPDSLGLASGLTLRYRQAGQPAFAAVHKDGTGRIVVSVSATELTPGQDVEYYLQLTDNYGGVLWEFGSERSPVLARARAAAPKVVVATEPRKPTATAAAIADEKKAPFYTQTWFFIAAGVSAVVLVAGATAATAVAIVATEPAGPTFGRVSQEVAN